MTGRKIDDVTVLEQQWYNETLSFLAAFRRIRSDREVYLGTASPHKVTQRRAKNRVAKQSRKANRK